MEMGIVSCRTFLNWSSESHHLAVRAAVVFEAVKHKNYFLDNTYLSGETLHANYLPTQYAIYSESYNDVNTSCWNSRTIEDIYKHKVISLTKSGCYCGMWQFYQAANVVGRPILSIYPTGYLSAQYTNDLNRKVDPIRLHQCEIGPLCVMWTPVHMGGHINHLVPVVRL